MPSDEAIAPLKIALVAAGDSAGKWPRALRGVDGVTIELLDPSTDEDLLRAAVASGAGAIAIGGGITDLPAAIKRAVMAGLHVLVTDTPALESRQFRAIDEVGRRRSRVVLFDTPGVADERAAFVRKMASGEHALWRPRYVRSIRTGEDGQGRSLDELALADLSLVLMLIGGSPSRVSAPSPRVDDESGAPAAAMMTLIYDTGLVARLDVSLIEPMLRHEIAVACDGRTMAIDMFDARAPLQIQASARHGGPQHSSQWAETVTEHPFPDRADRIDRAADAFASGVRARDASLGNAGAMAEAALVWETARASIASGGEVIAVASTAATDAKRPDLQLIRGGGRGGGSRPAPELKLVARSGARNLPNASA